MLQFQTSLLTSARDHHVAHSGSQLNDRDVGPRFLFDVVHSTRYTLDDLFVALAEEWRRSREEDVEDYTHGPHVAELVVFPVDLRFMTLKGAFSALSSGKQLGVQAKIQAKESDV